MAQGRTLLAARELWRSKLATMGLAVFLTVAAAGAVGLATGLLAGERALWLAVASAGLAVAEQAGDLLESAIKRRFGVKDSGTIIPGHGGVLDRLDGTLAVAVAVAAMALLGWGMPAAWR